MLHDEIFFIFWKKNLDFIHTLRSGFAISGRILQNGLITSKNLTVIQMD